jgi:quinol monooxygenase YgiN
MAYVLAVNWTAKEGHEAEIHEILSILGDASRQEPGVITYTTHVDPDNPREFFIYEKYHDVSGLEAHQETAHFKKYVPEKAIPLLESRVRKTFVEF